MEPAPPPSLALMLGGGGARGAYQAGVLRGLARRFPDLRFPILTGISAGAVNTIHLAAHEGTLAESTDALIDLWRSLTPEQVYEIGTWSLISNLFRWGRQLVSGGAGFRKHSARGMVETDPLRQFLRKALSTDHGGTIPGIARNLSRGTLHAVALSATSYITGDSMTWVEGRDTELWERPHRHSESTRLTVEHVMASSALPLLFPAVEVGGHWWGDGGIRLTAPLSPALHLGASHILTISNRSPRPRRNSSVITVPYPAPAQILGVLYNAVFLDQIDDDVQRLTKVNKLLENQPQGRDAGMRTVDIVVIRPSEDMRKLVRAIEPKLPLLLRYLTRGLGTRRSSNPDFLSIILFQREFIDRLIALGERDAGHCAEQFEKFFLAAKAGVVGE